MDLSKYYENISREPLLTKEEEHDLFLEMRDPGIPENRRKSIQDRIIRTGLRFVFKEAKRRSKGDPYLFEELIAAGNDGLLVGMDKYDIEKGFRYLTYAGSWVKQRMLAVMAKQRIVALPIWKQQLSSRIEKVLEAYPEISLDELKTHFPDDPKKDVEELYRTRFLTFYIEDMTEDSEFQVDPIGEEVNERLDNLKIHKAVDSLPSPHREVIIASFGLHDGDVKKKPSDVAEELKMSKDHLHVVRKEALELLRVLFGGTNPFAT